MMGRILAGLFLVSLLLSVAWGEAQAVSAALLKGAEETVGLMLSIGGGICLWSGIAEVMKRSGSAKKLSLPFQPLIRLIFGKYAADGEFNDAVSQNITANFLGLGNLATPMGLTAAARLHKIARPDLVLRLIVMNTASIQLIPTTVAAMRGGLGAKTPFDIMVPVICSSVLSVSAGLILCVFLEKRWKE